MSWTIAQVSSFPSCVLEQEVSGTVKYAMDPKEGDKGPSQFFVLKDDSGEIGVSYYGNKDTPFSPVAVGDKVSLQATMGGKGKLSGANKASYEKDGKTVPKLTVYGNRLTNLSRPADAPHPAPTPAHGPVVAHGGVTTPKQAILSENQAVETYWRLFQAHAGRLSTKVSAAAVNFDGFLVEADIELLGLCHAAAGLIFQEICAGRVSLEGSAKAAPRPAPATQPAQRRPDPDWATDGPDGPEGWEP